MFYGDIVSSRQIVILQGTALNLFDNAYTQLLTVTDTFFPTNIVLSYIVETYI